VKVRICPIRRVGERLRVSHHPGGEHDLADLGGARAETDSVEAAAVLEK
jgi:hypothetical protein